MLFELTILQFLSFITLCFFISAINVTIFWYLAGLYLIFLGFLLWLDDGDLMVGFLWVIDLGVGVVFFIFILHFSPFLHQKSTVEKSSRLTTLVLLFTFFMIQFTYWFFDPSDDTFIECMSKSWFFTISLYDFFGLLYHYAPTDLNTLREMYFKTNSADFLIINCFLFYGIVKSVLLCFLIKKIFSFLNVSQWLSAQWRRITNSTYFIRTQNFLKQQSTSTGTRVWLKKKNNHKDLK